MNPARKMLIELPAADEIDDLAITTPRLEVRKFELDMAGAKANLNYPPCKAQVVIVARKDGETVLAETDEGGWTLPSGMVGAAEEIPTAVKRIAREDFGLMLRSIELAGIYDVIWHYSDMTVKRLHFVYAAVTEDEPSPSSRKVRRVARPEQVVGDAVSIAALTDCKEK